MPRKTQTRNKQLVDDWVAIHGYICPGWNRPTHKAHPQYNRLSVDHIRPRRWGGPDTPANLSILCRACNSSKRDRRPPIAQVVTGPSFPHPLKNR